MPPGIIGFKRVKYSVAVQMGLNVAAYDTHLSDLRNLAVTSRIPFSRARDEGEIREFLETSLTIGNTYFGSSGDDLGPDGQCFGPSEFTDR
jgi:hypothetical protein